MPAYATSPPPTRRPDPPTRRPDPPTRRPDPPTRRPEPPTRRPDPPVSTIFIQTPTEVSRPPPPPRIHFDSSPTIPAPTQKPLSVVAAPRPNMPHHLGPPNMQHPTYFDVAQPVNIAPKPNLNIPSSQTTRGPVRILQSTPSPLRVPSPTPRRRRPRPTSARPQGPLRPRPTPFQHVTLEPESRRVINDVSSVNSVVTNEELVRTGGLDNNILVPTPPSVRQSTI